MKRFVGFERGMGIGGWLTNYKRLQVLPKERWFDLTVGDMEHFATYITQSDVTYIASLGLDHIRLGFDQVVLEEKPYCYREEIFKHLDQFVSWCKQAGLNIVFNLHKAIGNYCDIQEEIELLQDDQLQQRFIALWVAIEKRYHNEPSIAFELLNEVRNVDPEQWNTLADRTIKQLRSLNPTRKLIIGSSCWNHPDTLKRLRVYEDENIIYTFHFYSPFEFTHQRGVLQPGQLYYNRVMPYPDTIERYRDFQRVANNDHNAYCNYTTMDIEYIRNSMRGAVKFIKQNPNRILWCGEFGSIRHANIRWRENWMRDVITVLKENEIPYCVWNYLSTPNDGNRFSLVDDDTRTILSEEMAQIIRGNV